MTEEFINAVWIGDHDKVIHLIANGVDVNTKNQDGATLLHLAVQNLHISIAEILLSKGANVSVHDEYGITPLHVAAQTGQLSVVKRLMSMGANANVKNKKGESPIQLAALGQYESVIETLIDNNAKVDLLGDSSGTFMTRESIEKLKMDFWNQPHNTDRVLESLFELLPLDDKSSAIFGGYMGSFCGYFVVQG